MRNKRKTLAEEVPELAKQWHPTRNGDLKPTDVTPYSNEKVWWLYSYDDPETGKHFDFEWPSDVRDRTRRKSCPYLSGRAVWPGFNDLATKYPELAKHWHPTLNGDLKPTKITCSAHYKVFWHLPYDDPETGKHFDFVWEAYVYDRVKGSKCPYLTGKEVWPGFNDLATKHPELAKEWHPTKNGELTPMDVSCGKADKAWWLLSYDDPESGKHFDFEWNARIADRVNGIGCPYLSGQAVWPGFNDLASNYPELAKEWHFEKNRKRTPDKVNKGDARKYWWLCPRCGKTWRSSVYERTHDETQCIQCAKNKIEY